MGGSPERSVFLRVAATWARTPVDPSRSQPLKSLCVLSSNFLNASVTISAALTGDRSPRGRAECVRSLLGIGRVVPSAPLRTAGRRWWPADTSRGRQKNAPCGSGARPFRSSGCGDVAASDVLTDRARFDDHAPASGIGTRVQAEPMPGLVRVLYLLLDGDRALVPDPRLLAFAPLFLIVILHRHPTFGVMDNSEPTGKNASHIRANKISNAVVETR